MKNRSAKLKSILDLNYETQVEGLRVQRWSWLKNVSPQLSAQFDAFNFAQPRRFTRYKIKIKLNQTKITHRHVWNHQIIENNSISINLFAPL